MIVFKFSSKIFVGGIPAEATKGEKLFYGAFNNLFCLFCCLFSSCNHSSSFILCFFVFFRKRHNIIFFKICIVLLLVLMFLETITDYFSQYGNVSDCIIMVDNHTGRSRYLSIFIDYNSPFSPCFFLCFAKV